MNTNRAARNRLGGTAEDAGAPRGFSLASLLTSAGAVYGLVLVAGMIVISRNLTGSSLEALGVVSATLLVFFGAHVYAVAVGRLADPAHSDERVGEALRHGVTESAGMLLVGLIPLLALLLGVIGAIRRTDAVWLALAVDMLLLGALGWIITSARTSRFWRRLGGALLTAALGCVMILLKVLIH